MDTHPKCIGEFGDAGAQGGAWETPDLLKLPIDGSSETAWVLAVSIQSGAPAGRSGVQYFVGDFDGSVFQSTSSADAIHWADYGGDFYAAQTWNNTPMGARCGWRGSMTLACELADVRGTTMEFSATFRVDASITATRFGLKVRVAGDEATTIGYNRQQSRPNDDRCYIQ